MNEVSLKSSAIGHSGSIIAKSPWYTADMKKWLVGVDEAGEKARGAFARGCLVFIEVTKRNIDNLNSSCKEDGLVPLLYI